MMLMGSQLRVEVGLQQNGNSPFDRHTVEDQSDVIAFLADPATHDLPEPVRQIDTHAAIVFLAGTYAYKIKRAVRFPYLDFSDLDKRRVACEHELTVNRQNAPQIYIDTVAITRKSGTFEIGGDGPVVEWAVRMHRFDETATLDNIALTGPLDDTLVNRLANKIAAAHANAPRRDAQSWLASLSAYITHNDAGFKEWPAVFDLSRTHELARRSQDALTRLTPLIEQRGRLGHVRSCHGDLHLANIVLIDGEPVLFDAIEFDDSVATGDVLYDLGFLLMDLWNRGDRRAANRVLNLYLARCRNPDHLEALAALPLFLSLRAAIRAKVIAARLPHMNEAMFDRSASRALGYFKLAEHLIEPPEPRLIVVGGLSGSGKTTVAADLAPWIGGAPGALHLRSDVERKLLFGVGETDRLPDSAYQQHVTEEVYHRLMTDARTALAAGHSVIIDAVFARPEERIAAGRVADAVETPFHGIWLDAPGDNLKERVSNRRNDASDANAEVVDQQLDYDLGPLNWLRIDASGSRRETAGKASDALGLGVTFGN